MWLIWVNMVDILYYYIIFMINVMVDNGVIMGDNWLSIVMTPSSLDGLFHGKSQPEMDSNWGYPLVN